MIAALIIDMQNAFFENPDLAAQQDQLVTACNDLIDVVEEAGGNVLMVKTEHERDKSTWTLSMLDDDQGFIFRGTKQADFVPGLRTDGLPCLAKTRDSAFMGTDLLLRLRNWGVDQIILGGVSTHNCIAQTAADAFANNIRVAYAREAIGSEDQEAAAAVLSILSNGYRQAVLTPPQVKELLRKRLTDRR